MKRPEVPVSVFVAVHRGEILIDTRGSGRTESPKYLERIWLFSSSCDFPEEHGWRNRTRPREIVEDVIVQLSRETTKETL